jgi:hypothetical protein
VTILRDEFQPKLISELGLHSTTQQCADAWDRRFYTDDRLRPQIERATAWLQLLERQPKTNPRIGTSYHLKHCAEAWWKTQRPGDDYYVANGCLLMAASRLGFSITSRYEGQNPTLNISTRSLEKNRDNVRRAELSFWTVTDSGQQRYRPGA